MAGVRHAGTRFSWEGAIWRTRKAVALAGMTQKKTA